MQKYHDEPKQYKGYLKSALVASAVAVCLVFFAQERFRIPVIDPALAVGAGALSPARRKAANS